jgi:hypothetical protein
VTVMEHLLESSRQRSTFSQSHRPDADRALGIYRMTARRRSRGALRHRKM